MRRLDGWQWGGKEFKRSPHHPAFEIIFVYSQNDGTLTFDKGKLAADKDKLCLRADKPATAPGASAYKPSSVRREARKLDTQKQYAAWQKSYKELKRHRRGMSDVWYSQQIARQDISNNRNPETIRKHMKR